MSRYIDADKMLKEYQETLCFNVLCSLCPFLDNIKDDTCQVEKWINEQPTANVVEVVRCKDCKFRKIEFGWNGKKYKMCANTDYPTDDDAYCSYAERREDAEIH